MDDPSRVSGLYDKHGNARTLPHHGEKWENRLLVEGVNTSFHPSYPEIDFLVTSAGNQRLVSLTSLDFSHHPQASFAPTIASSLRNVQMLAVRVLSPKSIPISDVILAYFRVPCDNVGTAASSEEVVLISIQILESDVSLKRNNARYANGGRGMPC